MAPGLSIDFSKWAAAHGFTLLAAFLKSIFLWLAALDLSWAQELCIYMFIWMAKFGAAYGVRTGIHVGVDVLVNMLPAGSRRARDPVRPVVRRAVHRHRRGLRRVLRQPDVAHRPAVQRPGSADVDRLSGDPARLGADVLPLPAGRLVVLPDRRAAAPRCRPGRRRRSRCAASGRSHSARGAEGRLEPAGLDPDPAADPDRGGLLCACRRVDRAAPRRTGRHRRSRCCSR